MHFSIDVWSDKFMEIALLSEADHQIIEDSAIVYNSRRDVRAIQDKLNSILEEPEYYWGTLQQFIHGRCGKDMFNYCVDHCLVSNEAKRLHNEFIQAILHNAHFSRIPPPGVKIKDHPYAYKSPTDNMSSSKIEDDLFGDIDDRAFEMSQQRNFTSECTNDAYEYPDNVTEDDSESDSSELKTFTSSDLQKIQSFDDLRSRIEVVLSMHSENIELSISNCAVSALKSGLLEIIRMLLKRLTQNSLREFGTPYTIQVSNVLSMILEDPAFREAGSLSVREKFLAIVNEQSCK